MQKTRDNNYDLLRIVSCMAVILIHVSASFITAITDVGIFGRTLESHALIITIYNTLPRFAVPCFVMLAGAFALSNEKNADYRSYYKKIFVGIGIPTMVFSVLYLLYQLFVVIIKIVLHGVGVDNLLIPILKFLKGEPYSHLWYLYMMVPLYAIVPILIRWKKDISKKVFDKIVVVVTVVSIISGWTASFKVQWGVKGFAFIGYFLLGYVLRERFKENKKSLVAGGLIILGVMLEIALAFLQYFTVSGQLSKVWAGFSITGPLSPIIALVSVCIFTGFSMLEIGMDFSKVAGKTFLVFLIHGIVWEYVFKIVRFINTDFCYVVIPVFVGVVFAISYVLAIFYEKVGE